MAASPSSRTWSQRALDFEDARDLPAALDAWQYALAEQPQSLDIAAHLARLAFRLAMWDMAEKFYAHLITQGRHDIPTLKAYAETLREQSRFIEAIDLLKSLLADHPAEAPLWEALGTVLSAQGDHDTALVFFTEALRLAPGNLHARFHHGCALLECGQMQEGLAEVITCAEGFSDPDNRTSAAITAAQASLAVGDLTNGWRWYQARHKRGAQGEVHYGLDLPRYETGKNLSGKRLFLSAEQGLGDEVLFASILPDVQDEVAALGIAVEPRLVSLFQRSFPAATVVAHRTRTVDGRIIRDFPDLATADFDLYGVMGDLLPVKRARIADFPAHNSFLHPAPDRVAHWQAHLAMLGPKPKVGLLWKSLKANAQRDRYFAPFAEWQSLMTTEDVTFINLQYGDTAAEQSLAGLTLHTPADIDLKDDLDDLAALCAACDLVLGPSNATTNIAAACGVKTWIVSTPGTWLPLGQSNYPWYPTARLFAPQSLKDWSPVMADIKTELSAEFP